jgi:hypothetical protein
LEDLAALHFFVSAERMPRQALDTVVDQWASKTQTYVLLQKLREIDTPEAMAQLTRLAQEGTLKRTEDALHAVMNAPDGSAHLFELTVDGSLFGLLRGYIDVRQVGSVLARWVKDDSGKLHQVLAACLKTELADGAELAFELVAAVPSPDDKALDFLLELVERAGQQGKGQLSHSFEQLFEERKPTDYSPDTFNVSSRACNHLRAGLFEMAMGGGPSALLAAGTLLSIEERRLSLGRPSDEPRHPNLNAEHQWPQCLATVT